MPGDRSRCLRRVPRQRRDRDRDGRHERRDLRLHDRRPRACSARPVRRGRRADGAAARRHASCSSACRPRPPAGSRPSPTTSPQIEHDDAAADLPRRARARAACCWCSARCHAQVLRLDSLRRRCWSRSRAVPLTVMGGQAGILQGERRWRRARPGLPRRRRPAAGHRHRAHRSGGRPSSGAMVGVAIGACRPGRRRLVALRDDAPPGTAGPRATRPVDAGARSLHNSQALLAFFALSNVDIVVARNVLTAHDAGLYAGGLILTKAVLFLPQFVVVVAFPSMASADERRRRPGRRAWSLIAGLGARRHPRRRWLLPELALVFVGGDDVRRDRGPAVALRVLGTVLVDAPAAGLRGARPAGPALGLPRWVAAGRRWSASGSTDSTLTRAARPCVIAVDVAAARRAARRMQPRGALRGRSAPTVAQPEPRSTRQCAASCQLRPVPTETSSGTVRSAAPPICSRTSSSSASRSPGATSNTSSSWTWSSIRERSPASAIARLDVEHRDLDQVGRRALDRRVERHPLGHLAALPVVAGEVGQVAAPAQDGLGEAGACGPRRRRRRGSRGRRRRSRSTRPSARAPRRARCRSCWPRPNADRP